MRRSDGYRLRDCDPFYEIIPHIMPLRYDAMNYIDLELDLDSIHKYIKKCRNEGIAMSHMSVLIAAYVRLASQNPQLNRFVCNKRIYARNHFCVSFVTLKEDQNSNEETVAKIYFNLTDTIFDINEKVLEAISVNRVIENNNSMDRLLRKLMRVPFLVGTTVTGMKIWDRVFGLPMSIVDASPFHTSMFITNLASIRLNAVYHHLYSFGTTSIFIAMGQPQRKLTNTSRGISEKRVMPVKVTTDERIADGYYFGRCFKELRGYLSNPELLETPPESIVKDPNVKKKNPKFIVK